MAKNLSDLLAQIEIRKFSGEIAALTKTEFKKNGVIADAKSPGLQTLLDDAATRQSYVLAYEQNLQTAFASLPATELYLTLDKDKLAAYVSDAFSKFKVSTGGRQVDSLLAPVLGSGMVAFANNAVNGYLTEKQDDLVNLVNSTLSYLSQQGVAVTTVTQDILSQKINELQAIIPENYLNGTLLSNISNKAADLLKNDPAKIIISVAGDLKGQFAADFDGLTTLAQTSAQSAFADLGSSIKTLTDSELNVNKVLNQFTSEIAVRQTQITTIEGTIANLVKNVPPDLNAIAQQQIAHAQLVAQNLFHNNILNTYLQKGIQVIDTIDGFKDKAEKLFTGQYLTDFKNNLEVLKQPTFSGIVNFASQTANGLEEITGVMSSLHIFPGAAQSVGKFVNYAKIAIGVAAALLPPNPIGIIGALGSLGGLFGGGGPSMEEQMFQAMQQGFDQLNQRLDDIESQINTLTNMVQTMYKNLMQSLQRITDQLDALAEELKLAEQMLNLIIYQDYNMVEVVVNAGSHMTDSSGLALYSRWYNAVSGSVSALAELDKIIISPVNLQQCIREDFTQPGQNQSIKVIGGHELNAYKASLTLFEKVFPNLDSDQQTKNLLTLPPQNNLFTTYQQGYDLISGKNIIDFEAATENYYNAYFISKLVEQYITLHPFFILVKDNQFPFKPFDTLDDLLKPLYQQEIGDKLDQSQIRLTNLLLVINYSIIQQSIMAGSIILPYINAALYTDSSPNYDSAIAALTANELLAKNMAVYFINSKIALQDLPAFSSLYYEVQTDHTKLVDLNKLLSYGQSKLTFAMDSQNPANPQLCLYYTQSGTTTKIKLPVPDLTVIEQQQIIYSNSLFALLAAKDKVVTTLTDIGFFQNMANAQTDIYKQVFFTQS